MTSTYYAHPDIRQRRVALKRQRQLKMLQSVWRTLIVTTITGGLAWASFLPQWGLRQPEEMVIQGNEYLSSEAIYDLLAEATSEPVITLSPDKIKGTLEKQAPIKEVTVTRELYPSRLTIAVKESPPVAKTISSPTTVAPLEEGYIDANGRWMSQEKYQSSEALPADVIKVIGYRAHYRLQWAKVYPKIEAMSLDVKTINWQNPANLILETELGSIHLGGNIEHLSQQLEMLAQLRNLPQEVPPNQIRHINLKNPNLILVELTQEG
ncbi:FtsQ-type POTRA domain-containing protein [Euhalothece natronophila Z-M001]|uniref:FtsQ-type POTRA domain-containing protein n=1 Tax=Euhalothece natronophila Z-M001 TaxID=522448 RepID=A0A5B8NJJ5_9CHRO|nr:FtsQ-type POTRA domain-containing protein [Euhalothece natronophila]QDZ39164.1 FtsQ-type POTRA domain-containing protein [Euhalothece natronophila Z-M001]